LHFPLCIGVFALVTGSALGAGPGERAEWMAAHAVALPLDGSDDGGFRAIADLARGKPLLGLGESTHGTHEFQVAKTQIIRWLVENDGFSIVAVEAPAGPAVAVDHYIQTGEGDVQKLVSNLNYWTIATEETEQLVTGLREDRLAGRDVSFVGLDLDAGTALDEIVALAGAESAVGKLASGLRDRVDVSAAFNTSIAVPRTWISGRKALTVRVDVRDRNGGTPGLW
jgi:hypothetical protein